MRRALIEPNALLTCGASSLLAGGQTRRLGSGIRAEEALGTLPQHAQVARPGAPTIAPRAQKPGRAGAVQVCRNWDTILSFLTHAHGDAEAHEQFTLFRGKLEADLSFRALRIRGALAVGAERVSIPGLIQAAQRWVALGTRLAGALVRQQPFALLAVEDRADTRSCWVRELEPWMKECPQQQ